MQKINIGAKSFNKKKEKGWMAYFSMEFAFKNQLSNYAGGLGVLAADLIYSAADLGIKLAGVTLLYHQSRNPEKNFRPEDGIKKMAERVTVEIEGRKVEIAIWKKEIKGNSGHIIPIFYLSSNLEENFPWDRDLTANLYAGDTYTRLCQEAILGIGGVRALEALGYEIKNYHLNEGHAALVPVELLAANGSLEKTRQKCTFTTHTPLRSGIDYFDYGLAEKTLKLPTNIRELAGKDSLVTIELALNLSKKANAVSKKHKEVSQALFPGHDFLAITNGIYHKRWAGRHMAKFFNRKISGWEDNPENFSKAVSLLPETELKKTRQKEKADLVRWVNSRPEFFPLDKIIEDDLFQENILTLGFARRVVPYKRTSLIFHDLEKLRRIGYRKIQLVFAGKIYDNDPFSNEMAASISRYAKELAGQIRIAYIREYNPDVTRRLVAGCDVWLNNPMPGCEASGTSGMKAALNGVLNLSIMDGWWVEACENDPLCGWGFGGKIREADQDQYDSDLLLENLENAIDCYLNRPEEWFLRMKHSIALTAYFSTHRAIKEYYDRMWKV